MKTKLHLIVILFAISALIMPIGLSSAQTGAPPPQGPRACANVFIPGVIIDFVDLLPVAPDDIEPLGNIGAIARLLPISEDENRVPLIRVGFDLNASDNRGEICFYFEFQDFVVNEDDSRVVRIEQVNLQNEDTECVLPEDTPQTSATFTLDVYQDDGDATPITEDDLITDFSGDSDAVEEPILLVTNIPNPPPFEINLIYCNEDVAEDETPEFEEVPTLQEYCDAAEEELAESDDPDEALPDICDELISLPSNRAVFVIESTSGYFNYSVVRPGNN